MKTASASLHPKNEEQGPPGRPRLSMTHDEARPLLTFHVPPNLAEAR